MEMGIGIEERGDEEGLRLHDYGLCWLMGLRALSLGI